MSLLTINHKYVNGGNPLLGIRAGGGSWWELADGYFFMVWAISLDAQG